MDDEDSKFFEPLFIKAREIKLTALEKQNGLQNLEAYMTTHTKNTTKHNKPPKKTRRLAGLSLIVKNLFRGKKYPSAI